LELAVSKGVDSMLPVKAPKAQAGRKPPRLAAPARAPRRGRFFAQRTNVGWPRHGGGLLAKAEFNGIGGLRTYIRIVSDITPRHF
jgi:hypothetical protein